MTALAIASTRRSSGITKPLAFTTAAVSLAAALATAALDVLNRSTFPAIDAADPIAVVMPITFAVVGLLVATRQPRNPAGWLLLFIGVVEGLYGVADQYARFTLITHPGTLPGAVWALWYNTFSFGFVWPCGAAAMLLMLLPDGRLPSRRWRPLVALNLLLAVFFVFIGVLNPVLYTVTDSSTTLPNPIGIGALYGLANGAGAYAPYFIGLAVAVLAATAPFIRLRRADGEVRQQLKWIAYAVLVSAILSAGFTIAYFWIPQWANLASTLSIAFGFGLAFPIAVGIAIFKHGLYDIDVVISRTLVYGTLAVLITGVYVGIAVGFGELVGSGGKPNLGLSIFATAIVAVGFQPARERLQRLADRLVYGKRATPYQVLSEFSSHVASSYAADEVLPRMAQVLQEGTTAESATVWLRSGDELHAAATHPENGIAGRDRVAVNGALPALPGMTQAVEVRHQGELLGALSVVKRRGEALTPVEDKLLGDLAHQAGLVLKNVRLTSDLQRRLEDLRASRQRLVSAQDAERRRLERNLHDGAQQHLVALKVKLGLAEMLADRDPDKAKSTLAQLKADADEALETLRDLARGIYPPLLADRGLVTALEAQARKAMLSVNVESMDVRRYAQDVEATVYFCVLEALQNVQKYAKATQVTVRLQDSEAGLKFSVEDDGQGFDLATAKYGSGLTNMGDRLDAIGGSLSISSSPGRGTRLSGTIPSPFQATPPS